MGLLSRTSEPPVRLPVQQHGGTSTVGVFRGLMLLFWSRRCRSGMSIGGVFFRDRGRAVVESPTGADRGLRCNTSVLMIYVSCNDKIISIGPAAYYMPVQWT